VPPWVLIAESTEKEHFGSRTSIQHLATISTTFRIRV
jgi:hypothetical protein